MSFGWTWRKAQQMWSFLWAWKGKTNLAFASSLSLGFLRSLVHNDGVSNNYHFAQILSLLKYISEVVFLPHFHLKCYDTSYKHFEINILCWAWFVCLLKKVWLHSHCAIRNSKNTIKSNLFQILKTLFLGFLFSLHLKSSAGSVHVVLKVVSQDDSFVSVAYVSSRIRLFVE